MLDGIKKHYRKRIKDVHIENIWDMSVLINAVFLLLSVLVKLLETLARVFTLMYIRSKHVNNTKR